MFNTSKLCYYFSQYSQKTTSIADLSYLISKLVANIVAKHSIATMLAVISVREGSGIADPSPNAAPW